MADAAEPRSSFFVAGGTLAADATSYVKREADDRLFDALTAGEFCYVLNSRQMGKSSICVRTMGRLEAAGTRTAFVDLTKIGGRNVTSEQWYAGIAVEIGRSLELRNEILAFWKENAGLSGVQRLFGALRDVVLERISGHVAVFFDEIDATRSLGFSADEFFAAIRESYNRRVRDPELRRLTFCLLGVAVPSDLINSPTSTPFNIGERITLRDFTLEEMRPLAEGLSNQPQAAGNGQLLERVFHWTNGHPYLSQSLCAAVAEQQLATPAEVDTLVRRELFDPRARDTNINLADVANRALHAGDAEEDPEKFRADLLSAYSRALNRRPIADDESNRVASLLKLSGLTRSEANRLVVRNRIYAKVFGRAWIRENMPRQELRRQRRAYSLGVVRTAAIGAAVIAIVGWLAWRNRQLLGLITAQRDQMAYDLYVANVNLMQKAWDEHNPVRLVDLLRRTEGSPYRGWEWNYWNRLANLDEYRLDYGAWVNAAPSPDDKLLAVTPPDATYVFDAPTGKLLKRIPLPNAASFLCWSPDSRTLLAGSTLHGINLIDTLTGTPRAVGPVEIPSVSLHAFDGQGKHFVMNEYPRNGGGLEAVVRRVDNLAVELRVRPPHGGYASWVEFSPDGTRLLGVERPGKSPVITERAFPGGNLLASYDFYQPDRGRGAEMPSFATTYSANGNDVFVGTTLGNVFAYHHGAKSPYRSLHVSDASITSLDRSADGRRLICETSDLLVQVFDISSSRLLATIAGAAVSPNRDGSELYLSDTSVRAVKVDGYREFDALTLPAQEELRGGAVLVGSDRIAAASQDILHVYDNAGRELGKLDHRNAKFEPGGTAVPAGERRAVKLSPNGMGLAAIHGDECILTPNGDLSAALTLHGAGSPDTVLMCKGGPYYVTAELGQPPVLWSARTGEKAPMQIHAPWPVVSCGLSRDGRLLAVSNQDGDLQVWDLVGRSSRLLAKPGPNASKAFAFSADDRYLVLCCVQDAKLYDLKTGRIVQVFPGNLNGLNSIDFSPDGSRMVTASSDNTARIWDPASGRELLRLGGFKNPVVNAQFTSDGQDIVTFEEEGSIRILHGGLMR